MKRIFLASAPALCLIYSGLLVWSFFGNRDLQQQVLAAARAIPDSEGAGGAVPGVDALRSLESLRLSLVRLIGYERDGAPLRLRFGLYKGSEILPDVRKIYYAKFRQLLFEPAQAKGQPLTPSRWIGGRAEEIGAERLDLARRQFDFYAADLHNGNPYPASAANGLH